MFLEKISTESFTYSLSHPQKRIWYIEKLFPNTPMHNLAGTVRYNGKVDLELLKKAFNRLIKVNDATRLRFRENDQHQVEQYLEKFSPFNIETLDFSPQSNPENAFFNWAQKEATIPFKILNEPLYRFKLFRISETDCGYFSNFHHIISDGWSMQLLTEFISRTYLQLLNNKPKLNSSIPSYLEYIEYEKKYLNSPRFQEGKKFWMKKFDDLPDSLHKNEDTFNTTGKQQPFYLNRELTGRIRKLTKNLQISIDTLFKALMLIYLSKVKQSEDIVIGTPIFNRLGKKKMCFGMFVSTMPLRIKVPNTLSLTDFINSLKQEIRNCYAHQQYPYDLLVRNLKLRQNHQESLFDICINYYNTKLHLLANIGDMPAEINEIYTGHQVFSLYLVIKEWSSEGKLQLNYNFKTHLYNKKEISSIHQTLLKIFDCLESSPHTLIKDLPIVFPVKKKSLTHQLVKTDDHQITLLTGDQDKKNGGFLERLLPSKQFDSDVKYKKIEVLSFTVDSPSISLSDNIEKSEIPSLDAVILASLFHLLRKYSPQSSHLRLGKIVFNREKGAKNDTTVKVLTSDIDNGMLFRELIAKTKNTLDETDQQNGYTLEELKNVVLSDMAVVFNETPTFSILEALAFNVLFSFTLQNKLIKFLLTFNNKIYDGSTMERVMHQYLHVFKSACSNPETKVSELGILTEEDKKQILITFNKTQVSYPFRTIIELFEARVEHSPETIAIIGKNIELTYSAFNKKSNLLAYGLREKGIGANCIVSIMMERSLEMMAAIFAVLKVGGAYMPIDPGYPQSRINYLLKDSQAQLLITRKKWLPKKSFPRDVLFMEQGILSQVSNEVSNNLSPIVSPQDLAYVIYTSGSTGRPKGTMIQHLSLLNRICWMQDAYPIGEGDVILQKTPISFDVSVWELFWWSTQGGTLCLLGHGEEKEPESIINAIHDFKVTTLHFVPSMLNAFLSFLDTPNTIKKLSGLKRVFASGEALQPYHVNEFNKKLYKFNATRLINLYGPTEATVDVSYFNCPSKKIKDQVPIGRPISNIKLYVIDPLSHHLQPLWVPGELSIAGVGLARGYLNRIELTQEKFIENPFEKTQRLYLTGDLARWLPNGELQFLGRRDNQIKIKGYRIELGEIEAGLLKHLAVKEAAVIALETKDKNRNICGYVTLKRDCDESTLKVHLSGIMPDYMVPNRIIIMESFPLTPNGKLDRHALPLPKITHRLLQYKKPKTPNEKKLAEIWEQVLGVDQVGIHDNFFSLGGDSITFISALSRAKSKGLYFTFQQLYQYPTIYSLLNHMTLNKNDSPQMKRCIPFELLNSRDKEKIPPQIEDAYPLSVLQAGLIFQSEITRGTALYHDVFNYRIKGKLEAEKFSKAVQEMCHRHPIIRTTYHLEGFSEYIQMVHKKIPNPLTIYDLRGIATDEQDKKIKQNLKEVRDKAFNWEKPGMIWFHIHVLTDSEYIYTLSFHDSALDGWSVNLLHTELFQIYYSLINERENLKPSFNVSFRDFIEMERKSIDEGKDQDYWLRTLKNNTYTKLPIWPSSTSAIDDIQIRYHRINLTTQLSEALKKLAASLSVPIKTILLASHIRVLNVLTGNSDITTGYEYSGRPEEENGERILGLFLNSIPFRVQISGQSWEDLIRQVFQVETDFIPHRRYPMAHIKKDNGSQNPLFETVFNFTHFHVLKELKKITGFDLSDIKLEAVTEFILRAEFSLHPFSDDVLLWLHYHANIFPPEQIEYIGSYYARVLQLMVENPKAHFKIQSILSEQEKKLLLLEFNDNQKDFPADQFFHQVFENQAEQTPGAVAVAFNHGQWSYKKLNREANQLAYALKKKGIDQEQVIATSVDRNFQWLVAILAIFKIGGVYLPLEPEYPIDRINAVLEKSKCNILLKETSQGNTKYDEILNRHPDIQVLAIGEIIKSVTKDDNPELKARPNNLAYIIFTSGSSGTPKGAMIEQKGMLNHLNSKVNDLQLEQTDIIAQNASQCFDISVWQLLSGLLQGAKTEIIANETILQADFFIHKVITRAITILEVVPSYLDVILNYMELNYKTLDHLKYVLVTGEPVKIGLVKRWFSLYPLKKMVNAYGPTEASDDITHHIMDCTPEGILVPVGKPVQNLNIYVVDSDMQLVPIGSCGEVCVSGVGVGRGYINEPFKTWTTFIENPFERNPQSRLYKTGDIGRWLPDGTLELFGRIDNQVKIHGYRIEMGEIENQIQKLKDIQETSVIVDERDGSKELMAFYVSVNGLNISELKKSLMNKLPEYMIPAHFVKLEALPLTENGKISKQKLMEMVKNIKSEKESFKPPQKKEELKMANLWAEVLKIDPKSIGKTSNFFDLGGHSLKAMELAIKANGQFTINDIFKFPILEDIVDVMEKKPQSLSDDHVLIDYPYKQNSRKRDLSMVCFTYAGGNAVNFKPLFDKIAQKTDRIDFYGIELPGHSYGRTGSVKGIEETAKICLNEIKQKIATPIVLWGHCSGAALMLEVAKLLEKNQLNLQHIFIGGKIMHSQIKIKIRSILECLLAPFIPVNVKTMTNNQIKDWMVNKSGFKDFETIGQEESEFVIENFRHDAHCANLFFKQAHHNWKDITLKAPITNIVATDDLLTKKHKKKYTHWKLFSEQVELEVIKGGGHYFIKSKCQETANIILKKIKYLINFS